MSNQLTRKVLHSITVYNGTGVDIAEKATLAFDASNPEIPAGTPGTHAVGVKLTTSDADFVGIAWQRIPAGSNGSMQVAGVAIAVAGADITLGTHLALMTDSSGEVVPRTASGGKRACGFPLMSATAGNDIVFWIEGSFSS